MHHQAGNTIESDDTSDRHDLCLPAGPKTRQAIPVIEHDMSSGEMGLEDHE